MEVIENLLVFSPLMLMYLSSHVCSFLCNFWGSVIAVTHAEEDLKMGTEELKMGTMVDDINAYSYAYPLDYPSEKLVFKWY